MNKIERIKDLVKQLNQYRNEYYNQNKPSVTDSVYDKLFDELSLLEKECNFTLSNSPTKTVGYEVVSKLQKVTHKTPLLSLDKTKSVDELNQWRKDKDTILMLKADGLTIEPIYENGQLNIASTRGNGEIGELITHNALHFQNLPKTISFDGYLRLSGEAIIHWNDFNEINSKLSEEEKYKTPRNLVSGSTRNLDSKICAERKVCFYAFEVLECSSQLKDSKFERFQWLHDLGFEIIPFMKIFNNSDLNIAIKAIKELGEMSLIPFDGEVLTFDSVSYSNSLGKTQHHPLFSIAYKFNDETEETVLRQVEWNTTRSGQINPTGIFDTIELDGTEVSRASLFNLTFIKNLKLSIGCHIKISKRNMIIPYIEENLDKDRGDLFFPIKCPSCNERTYIENTGTAEFLYCKNSNCQAQLLDKFVHFVSRDAMNIEGLSEQILEKFINKGFLKSFADIYWSIHDHHNQIVQMDGFGNRSYDKLIKAIEKSKNVKMENFLVSLGIDGVGIGTAKLLTKKFQTVKNFINAKNVELLNIDGIGDITAESICQYRLEHLDIILDLMKYVTIIKPETKQSTNLKDLTGISFVVTGNVTTFKNRKELEDLIVSLNGKLNGSVSKNTNYLLNNDLESVSSKNQKAKELGIPIISEEEFNQMIGR
jgi:DNA ligase (NAD+)